MTSLPPAVQTLVTLMGADVVMGLLCALGRKEVSSSASYRGMTKKVGILLVVSVGHLIEPHTQGLPTGSLATLFYIVTESISVLENAARLGIPVPAFLREALVKLKGPQPPALRITVEDGNLPPRA